MKKNQGLSLVELLVAAAIFIVVLGLIFNGLQSSTRTVDTVLAESEIIQDIRLAGQIVTDNLSRAVYIYPPGSKITLNKSTTALVRNPNTGKNVWTIGKDPIIAFIQAPENPLLDPENCVSAVKPGEINDRNACLRFIAYYTIVKEDFVKADYSFSKFLRDDNNKEAWMLFEYRDVLPLVGRLSITNPPILTPEGVTPYLVADYLKPKTGFVPLAKFSCQKEGVADPECNDISIVENTPLNYLETLAFGEFQLEAEYKRRDKVIKSSVLSFPIAPKNLYAK